MLLQQPISGELPNQIGMSDKYQKPNVLKTVFIITNIIAFVSYLFTILAFAFTDADV